MLYPLKFEPILKDKIWGGTKLQKLFNKPTDSKHLGESWELSGYKNDESVVSNGFLKGNNLTELIEVYMGDLVGDKIFEKFGMEFPLLFKFIDANDDLSIQVHPNDEVGASRHNSFGKTEMWYVIDSDPGSELVIGFSNDSSREEYVAALENNKLDTILQKVPVKKGDVLFIPAGLVHAIGKGIVVAEIQENSDLTYRIYDYKRKDEQGNERELHTDLALDVINFNASRNPKTEYRLTSNEAVQLVKSDYFTTNIISFDKKIHRSYASIDSFIAYMCLEGSFDILYNENETVRVEKGETILLPAVIKEIELIPQIKCELLEVYIED